MCTGSGHAIFIHLLQIVTLYYLKTRAVFSVVLMKIPGRILYQRYFLGVSVGLVFFCTWCAPSYSQSASLDDIISEIQRTYDQTSDITAAFTQKSFVTSMNKTITEKGTVYLKKPARMFWDYSLPSRKKLIVNPDKAWLYVPDDNIVYVQEAGRVLTSKITMRFLTGIGKFREDFTISLADESGTNAGVDHYELVLEPRNYEEGIKSLTLTVSRTSNYITGCEFTDLYDNVTGLILSDIKTDTNPPDALFTFSPPDGVEVYEVP